MARRAAEVVAMRNLAAKLHPLRRPLADFRIESVAYLPDGSCKVVIKKDLAN